MDEVLAAAGAGKGTYGLLLLGGRAGDLLGQRLLVAGTAANRKDLRNLRAILRPHDAGPGKDRRWRRISPRPR